jgi:L-fucose mutarotase
MLYTKCLHPQILGALGTLGHGSLILISDGGYPHATASPRGVEKVYLNLAPGLLTVTQVLQVLKETVPIEEANVMTPPDGTKQAVFDDYTGLLPDVPFNYVKQFDFYKLARKRNVGLVIATGDARNYANLILKIGYIKN